MDKKHLSNFKMVLSKKKFSKLKESCFHRTLDLKYNSIIVFPNKGYQVMVH